MRLRSQESVREATHSRCMEAHIAFLCGPADERDGRVRERYTRRNAGERWQFHPLYADQGRITLVLESLTPTAAWFVTWPVGFMSGNPHARGREGMLYMVEPRNGGMTVPVMDTPRWETQCWHGRQADLANDTSMWTARPIPGGSPIVASFECLDDAGKDAFERAMRLFLDLVSARQGEGNSAPPGMVREHQMIRYGMGSGQARWPHMR
jgi:hypothetical protein